MSLFDGIYIIGLTGQSGAGKSTVSAMLRADGFSVIDADKISHRCAENPSFLHEVKERYPDCVDDSGLDRRRLAAVVFNSPEKLSEYTSVIFPHIVKSVFMEIERLKKSGERIIVLDAPTLFESGLDEICTLVVSVIAPLEIKISRLLTRDGIPVELVKSRLDSQKSEEYFRKRSDFIIVNDSDIYELERNTEATARKIRERLDV